jgi:hypothetical protein
MAVWALTYKGHEAREEHEVGPLAAAAPFLV